MYGSSQFPIIRNICSFTLERVMGDCDDYDPIPISTLFSLTLFIGLFLIQERIRIRICVNCWQRTYKYL
jgi:hypothetical protein